MKSSIYIRLHRRWARLWMRLSGTSRFGRFCCQLAALGSGGYKRKTKLARLTQNSFFSYSATIEHESLHVENQVYIGNQVVFFDVNGDGLIHIGSRSCIHDSTILETGTGGSITVGTNTHIQPRCHIAAYDQPISIGDDVQIAQGVGLYNYNHGSELGKKMREQAVTSKGPIVIGNDVWIGYGATILENIHIGDGAVVAAGAVVADDVPQNSIVAGVPAKLVGNRKPGTQTR